MLEVPGLNLAEDDKVFWVRTSSTSIIGMDSIKYNASSLKDINWRTPVQADPTTESKLFITVQTANRCPADL